MQQRDWSARSYKRKAGAVCTSPRQYRHQLLHETKTLLGRMLHNDARSTVQIVSKRGLGKAATTFREIVPCSCYLFEREDHGSVVTRANLEFVVDIFSRQILEMLERSK